MPYQSQCGLGCGTSDTTMSWLSTAMAIVAALFAYDWLKRRGYGS
jgi:hypothetical protein